MNVRATRRVVYLPPAGVVGLSLALLVAGCEKVPLLAPTGSTIILTALATSLPVDGTADIIAQVLEAAGTPPHSGTVITFTTTLGSIEPADARTDVTGRVTVKFRAGSGSGIATIVANSGGATTGTAGAIKIAIGAAAVARISASASPGTVPAAGGTSTIVANVADINGNVLPGVSVSFTTDAGSLSASAATTDSSGNAQVTLTTAKVANVTATAGITTTSTGTTPTTTAPQTTTVRVNVNITSTVEISTISPPSPTVGQTVSIALKYPTTTGGSPIIRILADWGDGSGTQTYSGQPSGISHAYSGDGPYLVGLTGVDSFGDTTSASTSITVASRPRPTVTVTKSAPLSPAPGNVVTFTVDAKATTGNVITGVSIDFGDPTNPNNRVDLVGNVGAVSHVYAIAGTYGVTATATDSSGTTGSGSTLVIIQ